MKNDLGSLNNYLFEELERLNDDEILNKERNFEREMQRSKAVTSVAHEIINNANVVLKSQVLMNEGKTTELPKMLETEK